MTTIDKRHGPIIKIEPMGLSELKLIYEHQLDGRTMVEAGVTYAQRAHEAGKKLRKVINDVAVGSLWASTDRAAYDAAMEKARMANISLLDVLPSPAVTQNYFDAVGS